MRGHAPYFPLRRPRTTSVPFPTRVAPSTTRDGGPSSPRAPTVLPRGDRTSAPLAILVGVLACLAIGRALHAPLPSWAPAALAACVAVVLAAGAVDAIRSGTRQWTSLSGLLLAGTASVVVVLALLRFFELASYMRLPADLLSFSESTFLNDILEFQKGLPQYTAPGDNNSYPYTPGAPIATYLLASLVGVADSVPGLRAVQFAFVLAACAVATAVVHHLARLLLAPEEYRYRPAWLTLAFALLFLVATDRTVNLYVHSLHNDGVALLVSVTAYWLIVRHALTRRAWLVVAMAVLPALGFLVKQNQLMWAGASFVYLAGSGTVRLRTLVAFVAGAALCVAAVVGACVLLWGPDFTWWVFVGLGAKEVSILRVVQHLVAASAYALMGLVAAWLLLPRGDRVAWAAWAAWGAVLGVQLYTSGVAWVMNHVGPGAVLAACWFVVAMLRAWSTSAGRDALHRPLVEAAAMATLLLAVGLLGFVRPPTGGLPADAARYVAAIEREFEGMPADRVLLDTGSWIYRRRGIVMKDRSGPVSLHAGKNQRAINDSALAPTIARIRAGAYDKILARQLDTPETWYDFEDRGTGVKAAILERYREVRRIPAVRGVTEWWPRHIVSEIVVLVPKDGR